MESMKLSLSRGTFNVRDRGNTDGIPLVMLHGWPESSYCWEVVAPFLREELRVIAPDLRGLGESERTLDPRCYQKRELAQDVIAIIDQLGVKGFFLVGHDWGGAVAQEVALAIPERTRRLVLMNIYIINNRKGNAEGTGVMQADGSFRLWYQYFQRRRRPGRSPDSRQRRCVGSLFLWKGRKGRKSFRTGPGRVYPVLCHQGHPGHRGSLLPRHERGSEALGRTCGNEIFHALALYIREQGCGYYSRIPEPY